MIYKQETQNSFPYLNEIETKRNHENIETDLSYANDYTIYINKPFLNSDIIQTYTNNISTSRYTWYNVIPLILLEQFSKYINLYFLIIAMLQLIKKISISHGQPVILLPLIVVVVFNGLKDLIEDLKRKNSDKDENYRKCLVMKKGTFEEIKWEDVKVGDIIKVFQNEYFPADIVLINSKKNESRENIETDGICYVETKNLDGETYLKYKHSIKRLNNLCKSEKEMAFLNGVIECSKPNEYIDDFNGFYISENNGEKIPIDKQSLLLRGTSLQETFCVYGIVVYIGFNTKIKKNQFKSRKKKSSNIEKIMNLQIILIFIFDIFLSFAAAILALIFYSLNYNVFFVKTYFVEDNYLEVFFITLGTSILIFTNLVPISLLVTMEIVKYIQGIFITWDTKLYDKQSLIGPLVQTSTLNEELGQVNFIFTDKTGTLTKNYMAFTRMNIGDKLYGNDKMALDKLDLKDKYGEITNFQFDDNDFYEHLRNPEHYNYNNIQMFLCCLSLCHTVYTQFDKGNLIFNSSSPDEMALINASRKFGYIFRERKANNQVVIEINGIEKVFTILDIIEYTLERKLMSVIVKCPDGKIRMFSKGADNEIRRRITRNPEQIIKTNRALIKFASLGLRTLMIAYKELTEQEYHEWNNEYITSYSRINDMFERIEKNLFLLGSTAIEDTLQDHVGDSISTFIHTGIKIWVLTGDKPDTAKSIAFSCNLLTQEFIIFELGNADKKEDILLNLGEIERKMALEEEKKYGLIVSSDVISIITSDHHLTTRFYEVSSRCNSVICCRISPKQKAQLVEIVRRMDRNLITLAIGDGANDVNMIKSAHVGVGIIGVEGNQASRAADYSTTQFSSLRRLLYVHGRESYRKNSFVVCYNFYKNVLLVTPQFWFGFYCYFSGQTLYDPWIYQLFNIFFTSLPIVWFGIYDKEVSFNELERNSNYYLQGIQGKLFNKKRFWYWIYYAVFQGIIVLFFTLYQNNSFDSKGRSQDLWSLGLSLFNIGSIIYTQIVLIANFQLFLSTSSHTYISIVILFFTFTLYFLTFLTNSSISYMDITNSIVIIFNSATFYFSSFLIIFICLMLHYVIKAYSYNFIERNKLYDKQPKFPVLLKKEPIQEYLINSNNIFYGSAFANEPGQTPYIAKKLL